MGSQQETAPYLDNAVKFLIEFILNRQNLPLEHFETVSVHIAEANFKTFFQVHRVN